MDLLGSVLTLDQEQVVNHYRCTNCGFRVVQHRENPRFVPMKPIFDTPAPRKPYQYRKPNDLRCSNNPRPD